MKIVEMFSSIIGLGRILMVICVVIIAMMLVGFVIWELMSRFV
jgi:hypothetical protein